MIDDPRRDFPLLERRIEGRPIVYLDSAATSLKPNAVLDAERRYSTQFTANVHRGKHALSEEASHAYESARRNVAAFLNADPREIVFVRNTTEALNVVASGLKLRPDDVVLAATHGHHSNLVPWMRAARLELLDGDPTRPLDPTALESALASRKPRVLALTHASNVTGVIEPVPELAARAHAAGAKVVLDAAQSAPHLRLDVSALGCDFIAFSGHKMLGPSGIGVLWGRAEELERLEPLVVGGGMVDRVRRDGYSLKQLPYRFEAGTPNVSGALGLAAAVRYLEAFGMDQVLDHDRRMAVVLEQALKSVPGVRLLMAAAEPRLAIASVAAEKGGLHPDQLAVFLSDTHQIMVRSGFHCAHPLFDLIGWEHGAVRVSAYLYNTEAELRRFAASVGELVTRLAR